MKSLCIFLLAAALMCAGTQTLAAEPEKPIIVVFNIEAKGVKLTPRALSTLSDYLATRLAATGAFQVVPREEIRKRLQEQKKSSYRECYDNACQIELGRELAAQKSLSTQLMRIGKRCVLTSNLYDLKRAATEKGATAESGCSEEALMASINLLVERLRPVEEPLAPSGSPTGTPVSVNWMKSNAGWTATMIIADPAIDVFYRLNSDPSYKNTGHTRITHPQTGKPMPLMFVNFPFTNKPFKLWVKYTNRQGQEMGPWDFTLDPISESRSGDKDILEMTKTSWVALRDFDGRTLVYFTQLMSFRGGINRIFYGLDKEQPDTEFKFPPHTGMGVAGITEDVPVYIEVPSTVTFVTVRLEYFDQTQSEVVTFEKM
jgi:hypothetical protein